MSTDPTEPQGGQQRRQSREMSLNRAHPPTEVPGYQPEKFLGAGAYGEVWVAVEQNTGRRVAIKFYAHRGGLDWSLLSREVEKLAFLFADRYVVQLLGVGWDAEPPYYIMEYLDRGSLAERLEQGVMPVDEAVEMFREVAVGLVHAHGKGVLHCDLKPANILLDQDNKPRLADFGQSRLSTEQAPALGTLFYMAPEQADMEAAPDARWDVYALGALLCCMLTGNPPHRDDGAAGRFEHTPELQRRLADYRRLVEESPPPVAHRQVRGVDRALAEIVDRCLAPDPAERFPNVQAVLDALEDRRIRRQRRPMMILGAVGPVLLLAVGLFFAWQGFSSAISKSDAALTERALQSNQFAARYVARAAGDELQQRWDAVERLAESKPLRRELAAFLADPETRPLLEELGSADLSEQESAELRRQFTENPKRREFGEKLEAILPDDVMPPHSVASWFVCDPRGVALWRVPESETIGVDFAWRSYYHGGPADHEQSWRPKADEHVKQTTLSAVFRSQATMRWIVAISTPIYDDTPERNYLGVLALTIEVGRLIELEAGDGQFAVLVDWRDGENKGVILQHPLFDTLFEQQGKLPDRFKNYRLTEMDLPDVSRRQRHYSDPLEADPEGEQYKKHWLAQMEPVRVAGRDTGWVVIVQETYEGTIGSTLDKLKAGLVRYGLIALAMIALVMLSLWALAGRLSAGR